MRTGGAMIKVNGNRCLALAAVLCAAGTGLAGERFRMFNIVPYSPGQEKRLAADCREYVPTLPLC